MDKDQLGYPGISQKERLYPVWIEERSPIFRILTDSRIGISSQPREHAFVQGAGEKERLSSSRVPLDWDNTPPVAPVARIQINTRGIRQRQLCWDAASNTTGVQLQIPGTSVVVATHCIKRGVVLRDSVSPAHTGSKRKGGALQQGMGAAIQEKENARVTH